MKLFGTICVFPVLVNFVFLQICNASDVNHPKINLSEHSASIDFETQLASIHRNNFSTQEYQRDEYAFDALAARPVDFFALPELLPQKQIYEEIPLGQNHNGTEQPQYRYPRIEQPNGNWLTRVSDDSVFGRANGQSTHAYSRRQVWNIDETLMIVGDHLIDGNTYEVINTQVPISSERVWSNVNPNIVYGIVYKPLPTVFSVWDISLGTVTEIRRFDNFESCGIGRGEGNLTNDDKYLVIECFANGRSRPILISMETESGKELGRLTAEENYNWASFSQSGDYIVVENNSDANENLVRYDRYFSNATKLTDDRDHGDLGIDGNGDDVFVMIGHNLISFIRLRDGVSFSIPLSGVEEQLGFGHISCRNIRRPGWCFLSTGANLSVGSVRIHSEVIIDSESSGDDSTFNHQIHTEFEPWGSHRSSQSSYRAQPRLSVSPSGNKIIFASDWYGTGEIASYTLEYREPPINQ